MRTWKLSLGLIVLACGSPNTPTDSGTDTVQLTVAKAGTGTGTVTGGGVDCGSTCAVTVSKGTSVTLTAAAATGSVLSGWAGCDSATGTACTVAPTSDRTVTATFDVSSASVILVSSDLTTATTWYTGKIYEVTKAINVKAPLTIQPGVVVRFDANAGLTVTSTISADGLSSTTPIVFTSAAAAPAAGDWTGITLKADGSVFGACQFLYAGGQEHSALTIADGFSAKVTGCIFAHHHTQTDTLGAPAALDASGASAPTVISGNTFFDNRVPLALNTTFSVLQNTFDNATAAPSNPQPNKYNAVIISGCGHVTASIAWPALDVPYVIGDPTSSCNYVAINTGAQLSIGSPARMAVVKFFAGGRLDVSGTILAKLSAFTSIRDDAHGGDTNADGTASAPAGGDWGGITLNASGSNFDQCVFQYAGHNNVSALVLNNASAVSVTNSTFAHHTPGDTTVRAAPALDLSSGTAATVVTNNRFYDTTVPLAINTTYSLDDSNAFSWVDDQGVTRQNVHQAIVVQGCGHVTGPIIWSAVKVPMVIGDPVSACSYIAIDAAGQLTLADGVVVKFFKGGRLAIAGTLAANATTGIVFTSYTDDAHGGDTDHDSGATAPAGGDWDGLSVTSNGSVLNKVSILYGGGASHGASTASLYVATGKSITFTNSVIGHSRTSDTSIRTAPGLDLSDASPTGLVVTGNTLYDCTLPLAINALLTLDDSTVFTVLGTTASQYQAVVVNGCGHVTASTVWSVTKVPLIIGDPVSACNYLTVDGAGHLTLGPNVALKFFTSGKITVSIGGLFTYGSTDRLTSWKDDFLTDSNADGTATTPAAGDWYGVKYFHQGSPATCDESAVLNYQTANNADHSCSW